VRHDAADVREVREVIDLTMAYHSPARGRVLAEKARSFYAELAIFYAREMLVEAGFRPAWKQILGALRLCHNRRVIWQISSFFVLWFRIIASRLKRRMKSKANAPGPVKKKQIGVHDLMQLSVIISCHNRAGIISRVLEALRSDAFNNNWELLVVDNASEDPVSASYDISWHPNARHVLEENIGLTCARLRGIAESRADLLVFVDDDNVLAENYLDLANQIAIDWRLLGAWGGQQIPEFEGGEPREDWKRNFWTSRLVRDIWSNNYDRQAAPVGPAFAFGCSGDEV
jgi:hypothetical protein